jgi:antitoxin HigA-1
MEMLMTSKSSTTIEDDDILFLAPEGGFKIRALHPGRLLAEEIEARGLTAHALAIKLRVPANRISEIVAGRRSITPETSLRLQRHFGISADFWLRIQMDYDLQQAEKRLIERIEREVEAA